MSDQNQPTANFGPIGVASSNIKSLEFIPTAKNAYGVNAIRVTFIRGDKYDYFPCTYEEFVIGVDAPKVTPWFNDLKATKSFKKVE